MDNLSFKKDGEVKGKCPVEVGNANLKFDPRSGKPPRMPIDFVDHILVITCIAVVLEAIKMNAFLVEGVEGERNQEEMEFVHSNHKCLRGPCVLAVGRGEAPRKGGARGAEVTEDDGRASGQCL